MPGVLLYSSLPHPLEKGSLSLNLELASSMWSSYLPSACTFTKVVDLGSSSLRVEIWESNSGPLEQQWLLLTT